MNLTNKNKNNYDKRWNKNKSVAAMCGHSTEYSSYVQLLLCALFGFPCRTKNVHGHIMVNGRTRELKRFRRQAAYIMQDHELQPFITVLEAMHFSANLKVGGEMSQVDKKFRVSAPLGIVRLLYIRHYGSAAFSSIY